MDASTIAAVGMQDDLARLATVSHNLANVTTPGYKKQVALEGAFGLQLAALLGTTGGGNNALPAPAAAMLSIDASAGPLRPGANRHEVAIEGDSFFELAGPQGPAFTRQGALRVDLKGVLVGSQGLPMMGSGGAISLLNEPFTVTPKGEIEQGGRVAGQLRRVRFDRPGALVPMGDGMYAQGAARVLDAHGADPVRAGFQESSNVNSPREMVRLTEIVRHFESLQKIVQGHDDSLEKTIRKLGEF
jgi:flagellar basal-body rod protein FlgF